MSEPLAAKIPLLNPNEPEALIAEIKVEQGEKVELGAELAIVETTKASAAIIAEGSGYVCGLQSNQGQTMRAGEVLLWLSEDPEWQPPEIEPSAQAFEADPADLRITDPARAFAEAADLNFDQLPKDKLITEEWLRNWLGSQKELPPIDQAAFIVYGGGGHGKAVIELIRAIGKFNIVGLVDDGVQAGTEIMGVKVLGGGDELNKLRSQGIGQAANAVGGIGDIASRVRVDRRLQANGFSQPTLVHPTAFVEPSASLGQGVQIFPHAYIGSQVTLGHGVIVNTAAVVSHDCRLAEFANIAPGALLAGSVEIDKLTLVGMGVTINLEVSIGAECRLGNSSVIKTSVPSGSVVPAGAVWPLAPRGEGRT